MAVNGMISPARMRVWLATAAARATLYTAHSSPIDARMCSFESKKTVHLRGKRMCGESFGSFENSLSEMLRVEVSGCWTGKQTFALRRGRRVTLGPTKAKAQPGSMPTRRNEERVRPHDVHRRVRDARAIPARHARLGDRRDAEQLVRRQRLGEPGSLPE